MITTESTNCWRNGTQSRHWSIVDVAANEINAALLTFKGDMNSRFG
jgi:hypothetical protein